MMAIASSRNALMKHWSRLQSDHVYRYEQGRYLVDGIKMVRELIEIPQFELNNTKHSSVKIACLAISKSFSKNDKNDIVNKYIRMTNNQNIYVIDDWIIDKITDSNSEGIFVEACMTSLPEIISLSDSIRNKNNSWLSEKCKRRLLILDGIRDPGNMGTILRSALAFHWHNVISISPCVDYYHPGVIRASRHSHVWMNLGICNISLSNSLSALVQTLGIDSENSLSRSPIWLVADKPDSLSENNKSLSISKDSEYLETLSSMPYLSLVLGSESHGPVSFSKFMPLMNFVRISIDISNKVESLNVASSASILMHALQDNKCNICNQ